MTNGNSITLTDPVTGEVHVHWYAVSKGKLRATVAKQGISISIDYAISNAKLVHAFLTTWIEEEQQRLRNTER